MTQIPVRKIAVFGNGLAGLLCATKLAKILPKEMALTYVEATKDNKTDIFFGTTTSPSTYDFFLGLDITEPNLVQLTNTSFSLGTHYQDWGPEKRSWTQSFHRPLPTFNGVDLHHYLTRLKQSKPGLSDINQFIMAVQAAEKGVFAHPPEGKNIPLRDVEYGYHILPADLRDFISEKLKESSVEWIKADIDSTVRKGEKIQSIFLSNGHSLNPDFIVDALGPGSILQSDSEIFISSGRKLAVLSSFAEGKQLHGVCRNLSGTDFGWQAVTPLQNGTHHLIVSSHETKDVAFESLGHSPEIRCELETGRLEKPWTGNCLTMGHGTVIVEPLTPAPLMLLQRDIERLAELIPVTGKMDVEAREYNRRFNADYEHADLFSQAFFEPRTFQGNPYWDAACKAPVPTKLNDKINQFESRGVLVQYDYEPFTRQDWAMQHFGMGRTPKRYDPLADHIPLDQLKQRLIQMKTAIDMMAKKMPPHSVYMTSMLKYLRDKNG